MSPNSGAVWAPVSVTVMRHILAQVRDTRELSDEDLARTAQGFLAPQPGPPHFAIQRRVLGDTTLLLRTMSAMRVSGNRGRPGGNMNISFILSGQVTVTPKGGESVPLGPGAACAIADWESFDTESTNGTRYLQIVMPEERLAQRGVRTHSQRFQLDASRSLRAPLRGFALAVADAHWKSSPIGEAVAERTIEDLVVGMFLEADGFAMDSDDLRASLRGRALSEIASKHRDPDLSPTVVAEHLAVSLRHLQRAFEDSGSSIAGAITQKRAETASLLLAAPGALSLTIDEVAKRSGFSSAFELRAAFRSRYGMLPSEYRESSLPARSYVPEEQELRAPAS